MQCKFQTTTSYEEKHCLRCEICKADFIESVLQRHIELIHEGRKKFTCETCDASFGRKESLNRHITLVHEGKKPFACITCNANFCRTLEYAQYISS